MSFVIGRTEGDLDFDSLVGQLRDVFPESTIISDDYYRDRLEREKEIAKQQGILEDSAPILCAERVALKHGTQRHIAVRLSPDITLGARVDKRGVLAVGGPDTVECPVDIRKLIQILRAYNMEIETSWDDGK